VPYRSGARVTVRPPARLNRPPLEETEIRRIRRERLHPDRRQWDYLHLRGLRRALDEAFANLPLAQGPVLDLFCGTKPYLELLPWGPVCGMDLDRHFGRADVLGGLPLPFADAAFGVGLCTQALHLTDDPVATVAELARVTAPGGHVIVTVPHLFLREAGIERRWGSADLAGLFAGWDVVTIRGIDGPGAALSFVLGRIAMLGARRWRAARLVFVPAVLALNTLGTMIDRLGPLRRRWPHSLLLIARRP
jgi:SAM-dependent methyltransferase